MVWHWNGNRNPPLERKHTVSLDSRHISGPRWKCGFHFPSMELAWNALEKIVEIAKVARGVSAPSSFQLDANWESPSPPLQSRQPFPKSHANSTRILDIPEAPQYSWNSHGIWKRVVEIAKVAKGISNSRPTGTEITSHHLCIRPTFPYIFVGF